MNTLRTKAIVLSIVFTMCVLVMPFEKASADSFPSEFFVNSEVYYSPEAMFMAYTDLNETQREICAYLLGMYNLMYLGARGFEFKAGAYKSESEFIAKIKSFGYRFLMGAGEISLKSRMNADFCKYASACILYSSLCNVQDFSDWFENLDDDFVLPVDQGLINSFTILYNDNDVTSISLYGDVQSNWDSGVSAQYAFDGISDEQNNWMDNIFSQYEYFVFANANVQTNQTDQAFIGFNEAPDTLFIKRYSGNSYKDFAWGNYYGNAYHRLNFETYHLYTVAYLPNWNQWNRFDSGTYNFQRDVISTSSYNDLSSFIEYIFANNSIIPSYPNNFKGKYPYIQHVCLVDDLGTLSNLEEVYNTDSWDIVGGNDVLLVPVDNVNIKPKVITTIDLPDNTSDSVPIQDIINIDNTVDNNNDPVNPWQINVIVQPNETNPISIDVNMFSSGKIYLEYLWEHTKKVAMFAKDILDCFEFDAGNGETYGPKYAIYGVLVLGVAGGMIAKFLL